MKREKIRNKKASIPLFSFLFSLFSFLFISCENPIEQPFRAGLGPVADTRPPTVTLESPTAGKYIYGEQLLKGSAEDDYKLDRVELWVTAHAGFRDETKQHRWAAYEPVMLNLTKQNTGNWSDVIDTSQYKDGNLKVRLRVWDSYNKESHTDEVAFYVKNEPTAISMTAPYIARGNDLGEVGEVHLNYDAKNSLPPGIEYPRKVPKGDPVTGSISHDEGIYTGPVTGNRFPPQIRLWWVSDIPGDLNPGECYLPGVVPPENELPWHTFNEKELMAVGIGNYIFHYDFPEDGTARFYGFEIRAQNEDGRSSFHYPRDYYPPETWNNDENKYISYILVYYSPDNETPVVEFYALENIQAYWESGGVSYPYPILQNAQGGDLNDDQPHPYVNNLTVDKNGEFILRIKASHSAGIGAAEVYWEKKDSTQRGRFIWEPADYDPASGWDSSNNVSAASAYNMWGYREPYDPYIKDKVPTYRSFFFHYRHNGAYRVPAGSQGGRTQVQLYNGAEAAWQQGKIDGSLVTNSSAWTDVSRVLEDGSYRLEIYARTPSMGRSDPLLEITIRLDTEKPSVKVNRVDGAYRQDSSVDPLEYTVNGVIQPMLSFSDNGSGLRLATQTTGSHGSYFNNGTALDYEQFFILVNNDSRTALESIITNPANKTWWPIDENAGVLGVIPGVTVLRNKAVFNSAFKLKTSPIYGTVISGNDADALSDNPNDPYWVYAFCRDNAFNVEWNRIKLNVRADTDIPVLDFSVGVIKEVTNPDVITDNPAGFLYQGVIRNKLAGGSSIRLTIKDDDSLDLGTAAADGNEPSGVTIRFAGSTQDAAGHITALTGASVITLEDVQIKTIFAPQPVSGGVRQAVKSRLGEISQKTLVDALNLNGNYGIISGTSLPDGMYYFTIDIQDYPPLKMKMADGDPDPEIAANSQDFWIVVDSKSPVITLDPDSVEPNKFIRSGIIKGTVSDENGPVTVESYSVTEGTSGLNRIQFNKPVVTRNNAVTTIWEGSFNAPVTMHNASNEYASGRFKFTITFTDRFGNTKTLEQYLQVDDVKPTAAIGTKIPTFERDYPDVDLGSPWNTQSAELQSANKKCLANGVVNFRISASDNIKLEEAKWWLVPADTAGPISGDKNSYDTYTSANQGTLTANFNTPQYIDTALLADGAYILYVMAIDSAENVSILESGSQQTIFLLQEQDKPYFGYWDETGYRPITPDNLIVVKDATIRGSLYDDDGFDTAPDNPAILSGSVKIWMSTTYNGTAFDINNDSLLTANGFTASVTYGNGSFINTSNITYLSRTRKGVINMSVNLLNLFAGSFSTNGTKYYIIEATDSHSGKFHDTSGAPGQNPADRTARRRLFSFIYDTKNPDITFKPVNSDSSLNDPLNYPSNDSLKTFGPNADKNAESDVNFHLKGKIRDANLHKTADDKYYFKYRLDSGNSKEFKLDVPKNVLTNGLLWDESTVLGETTVTFEVSAERFCSELNFMNNTAVLSDITHTITFFAYDQSGNEGAYAFSFIKDLTPPKLTFTDPAPLADTVTYIDTNYGTNHDTKGVRLPELTFNSGSRDWWTYTPPAGQEQNWYKAKRNWLETVTSNKKINELPVVSYDRSNPDSKPRLKVTFDDVTSTINTASLRYWIDGEASPRTAAYAGNTNVKSASWWIYLTDTGKDGGTPLADGVRSIRFEIQDSVGNLLEADDVIGSGGKPVYYGFRIDSGKLEITMTEPVNGKVYGNVNGFAINVTAKGPNLKNARLRIKYPGSTAGEYGHTENLEPAADGGNWSFDANGNEVLTWTTNIEKSWLAAADNGNGDYELELRARGRRDDLSDPYPWSFTIDKSPPVLTINEFPAGAALTTATVHPNQWNSTTAANRKVFTSPSQRIQGRITDTLSNLKNAQFSIQRYNYAAGNWQNYYTRVTDTTGNWDVTNVDLSWNEIPGSAGKERQVDLTLGSIAGISDGLYRIRLRAKDSSYLSGSALWTNTPTGNIGTVDGNPQTTSNYYYFFYAPSNPTINFDDDAAPVTLYSAAASSVILRGTAVNAGDTAAFPTSGNGFEKLEVTISGASFASTAAAVLSPLVTANPRNSQRTWTATLSSFTDKTAGGAYTLTFTLTDWAGNTHIRSRDITLDNTPPTGKFTEPNLLSQTERNNSGYAYASDTFYGGDDASIAGTAEDANRLAGIWYHLGYIGTGTADVAMTFPTPDQVMNSVAGVTLVGGKDVGGAANNALFDAAAKADSGEAWFKYDSDTATYPPPDFIKGSVTITEFIEYPQFNLYDWKLFVPLSNNLSRYAETGITVKGRTYNTDASGLGAGYRMAQKVNESGLSPTLRKNGLYSLPLWVRVADTAGNVTYFCQDIWLYPNGDYPGNVIINPQNTGTLTGGESKNIFNQDKSRGGAVLFNGMASDNRNVKSVIYRIRADNIKSGDTGWTAAPTGVQASQFIEPAGGTRFSNANGDGPANSADAAQWAIFTGSQNPSPTDTMGWYKATLESENDVAQSKPWDFYVNGSDEFTTKGGADNKSPIERWGFATGSSGAADMIRVYVETLVFDGGGTTNQTYNKMSLSESPTEGPGGILLAKPDTVIFYLSSTSPKITLTRLSNVNMGTTVGSASYSDYTAGKTRSGRFAVQATFNSGAANKQINKVQVRLRSENNTGDGGDSALANWRDAWDSGSKNLTGITFNPANPTGSPQSFTMTYAFRTNSAEAAFQQVMTGQWAARGGKYLIDVRLYDNSTPSAETSFTFELGIDNFAPVEDTKVISNTKVAGSNVNFMGRVYDYYGNNTSDAPPRYYGVDRIYAWFTTNANSTDGNVNMTDGSTRNLAAANRSGITAYQNRTANFTYGSDGETVTGITLTAAGTSGTRYYPQVSTDTDGKEISNDWVKVISEANAGALANNMNWQPITTGRSVLWSFMTDTTKLPDGLIYLNYIVVDSAGNASRFQQSMVVMNKYPVITDLTLYTNNTGEGAVFTTHEGDEASSDYKVPVSMPEGYLNSGFISKNRYIGFRVDTASGNPPLHYRVQHVTRSTVTLTNTDLKNMADTWKNTANNINLYTIKDTGNMGDATWATLMGKPKVTAAKGMHFVFQAGLTDVQQMPNSTAEVYRYTLVGSLTKVKDKDTATSTYVDDKDYSGTDPGFRFLGNGDFGTNTTQINEKNGSHPNNEGGTNSPDGIGSAGTAFFLIKVWDSVTTTGSEDDRLYDALVVGMNVYLSDTTSPIARLYDLNPYTEIAVVGNNIGAVNQNRTIRNAADPTAIGSNIVRGGLFNTNIERDLVKSGYIEPRATSTALNPRNSSGVPPAASPGLPLGEYPLLVSGDTVAGGDTRDKVSGRVILRGLAWDDQLIDEIRIIIGGVSKTILKLDTDPADNIKKMMPQNNSLAFAVEELHWKTGHTVEWAYIWDTEKEPIAAGGGPLNNVAIQVSVKDKNSTGLTGNSASLSVDIVPYITGFQRETPKFATTRSRQGWYSFYQGEENIAVLGYNFGTIAANVGVNLSSDGGAGSNITPVVYDNTLHENTQERFSFTMPTTASSGRLNVTVNSIPAHNHTSVHTNKSWNRESSDYTNGSELWTNKPYAHIWRSTRDTTDTTAPRTIMAEPADTLGLQSPAMALEYAAGNGALHGAWAIYGREGYYYGKNDGSFTSLLNMDGEPSSGTDISMYNGTGVPNVSVVKQDDGRPVVRLNTTLTGNNTIDISDQSRKTTQRWLNSRISKAGVNSSNTDPGLVYITAYDAADKYLFFGMRNGTTAVTRLIIDGVTGTTVVDTNNPITNAGLAVSNNAGEYSAVDYDNIGPIVAYYDQEHDTVRIAYAANTTPGASNWTRKYLLANSDPLYRGSGKHISMKVDKDGIVHLAFYNSIQNTVVYAYSSAKRNAAADDFIFTAYTIDNVIKGGTWTDISVDNYGNPMIVYGDTSRTGNYDGIRIAYKSGPGSGDSNTAFTRPTDTTTAAGWEALTMPANYTVNNDRLNIEAWPPTARGNTPVGNPGWNAAIGYAGALQGESARFRIGYFYLPDNGVMGAFNANN